MRMTSIDVLLLLPSGTSFPGMIQNFRSRLFSENIRKQKSTVNKYFLDHCKKRIQRKPALSVQLMYVLFSLSEGLGHFWLESTWRLQMAETIRDVFSPPFYTHALQSYSKMDRPQSKRHKFISDYCMSTLLCQYSFKLRPFRRKREWSDPICADLKGIWKKDVMGSSIVSVP